MSLNRREVLSAALPLIGAQIPAWAATDEKPQYGGHLRTAYNLEPTSLDPHTTKSGGDYHYWRPMFDQLVDFDQSGKPDPSRSLATSWEFGQSPPSITFTLRQGVQFHDGTPFNAEAVKKNIERILDPAIKSLARVTFSNIKSVEVLGEHKVRLNLSAPWGAGLGLLQQVGGAINSPTAWEKAGKDYTWAPVGTGPYKLKEVVTGSFVRLVRNENYWRKDKAGNKLPYLDEVTIRVIKDETVQTAALRSGELDIAFIPFKDVDMFRADKNFTVTKFEGANTLAMLVANPDVAPMNDVRVRRAVMHAINPADINKAAAFGKAISADAGLWPTGHAYHKPSGFRPGYDLAKAKELLTQAGKGSGFELPLLTYPNATLAKAGEVVRAQLARVGIKVNLETLTVGAATDKMFVQKSAPFYLTGWSLSMEPDSNASQSFRSGGFYNPAKTPNPDMDALVAEAAATYDIDKRRPMYQRMSDMVLAQALWNPLVYNVLYAAASKKVGNVDSFITRVEGRYSVKELWLKKA